MGLDAYVYCDCFEAGRLRQPPAGSHPSLAADGSVLCGSDDIDVQIAFDGWRLSCEHPDGKLLDHRIGNIALVGALRTELEREHDRFPRILSKVLYNGAHCGDFIELAEIRQMRGEIKALVDIHCEDSQMETFMREFESQITELVECALRVGKPIVF